MTAKNDSIFHHDFSELTHNEWVNYDIKAFFDVYYLSLSKRLVKYVGDNLSFDELMNIAYDAILPRLIRTHSNKPGTEGDARNALIFGTINILMNTAIKENIGHALPLRRHSEWDRQGEKYQALTSTGGQHEAFDASETMNSAPTIDNQSFIDANYLYCAPSLENNINQSSNIDDFFKERDQQVFMMSEVARQHLQPKQFELLTLTLEGSRPADIARETGRHCQSVASSRHNLRKRLIKLVPSENLHLVDKELLQKHCPELVPAE